MRYDIVLAGVGGQGVLSMAALIGRAAFAEGLTVQQSEVHGMAQRGATVQAHLRIADAPIHSPLISRGGADLILSLEPVEALRHLPWLAPSGMLVTAAEAVVNAPDYPPHDDLIRRVHALPSSIVVEAERLAEAAGDQLAVNTVMVGAASHRLPLRIESLQAAIRQTFAHKGERTLAINLAAFAAGREAAS